MIQDSIKTGTESGQERFERILAQGTLEGLKAILEAVSSDRTRLYAGVNGTNSYGELLARLGYKLTLTRQIHVQDAYARMAPGGIKTVLPYHDIPTQSSLPTLINYDGTVTTTAKGEAFFTGLFAELKKQLSVER